MRFTNAVSRAVSVGIRTVEMSESMTNFQGQAEGIKMKRKDEGSIPRAAPSELNLPWLPSKTGAFLLRLFLRSQ